MYNSNNNNKKENFDIASLKISDSNKLNTAESKNHDVFRLSISVGSGAQSHDFKTKVDRGNLYVSERRHDGKPTVHRSYSIDTTTFDVSRLETNLTMNGVFEVTVPKKKKKNKKDKRPNIIATEAYEHIISDLPKEWQHPADLENVPKFYPMEQSNDYFPIKDYSLWTILHNIKACLQVLSVQAIYFSHPVSAALLTMENVEMYLGLWLSTDKNHIIVEIQRRRGDSVTFGKYSRYLLQAAAGDFDPTKLNCDAHQELNVTKLKQIEALLYGNMVTSVDCFETIGIVFDLLTEERIDTRLLGLEACCFLTNPKQTAITTCVTTAKAVLLGEPPFNDVRDRFLHIIYNRNMGDDTFGKTSACKIDSDDDSDEDDFDYFIDQDDRINGYPSYLIETLLVMFNLALTVLAHSLELMINVDAFETVPRVTTEAILEYCKQFSINGTSLMTILLQEIGKAKTKPHNACLSARCLQYLCMATEEAVEAVQKDRHIVEAAELLGVESHAKLAHECHQLLALVPTPT